jgi:hypothetical protein
MDTWIVLIEDRHDDVDALPFSTEEAAIEAARGQAGDMSLPEGVTPDQVEHVPGEQELTPAMRADGWVLCLVYSIEGDRVRVIKRTMDVPEDQAVTPPTPEWLTVERSRRRRRELLEYTERNQGLMSDAARAELARLRAEDGDE